MASLKTIDVAIGVAFLYLLLTFGASAIVEIVATARNWRALMLHDAIKNMLSHGSLVTVENIYSNPLVLALCRNNAAPSFVDLLEPFGWRPCKGGTPPSYIPAATFSAAVLETLIDKDGLEVDLSPDGAIDAIRTLLTAQAKCPSCAESHHHDALRSILKTTLVTQGASIQAVRFALEKWFNDTMDRTSGWYKRRTQSSLLVIGLLIAFVGNLNTIAVGRWLWQGDAARQAAMAAASDYIKNNPAALTSDLSKANKSSDKPVTEIAPRIFEVDEKLNELQYPIGWHALSLKGSWKSWILEYLMGALITAIAISMGSTFWFDAIQSLLKIRGTGPKPEAR